MRWSSPGVFRRRMATLAALAAAGGLLVLAPPGVAAAGSSGPVGVAGASTASATVTLLTGDQVRLSTAGGRTSASVRHVAASGPASVVTTLRVGDTSYAIPAIARPYLGRYLDPSLFDVSSPAGATGSRVAVDIDYTGSAKPSLPGVTVTSAAGGHATGYLTAASAKTFGAALTRQAIADTAAGWPDRSALFGSVTRVAAVGSGPIATPSYPMHTLRITAIGHTGKQLRYGFGFLLNADDGRRFGGFFTIDRGQARVSVPTGHYLAISTEDQFTPSSVTSRLMVASDYTVRGDGQTLTLDARRATAVPTVTTPRPALVEGLTVDVLATDAKGSSSIDFGLNATPGEARLFLPPTPEPRYGTLVEQTTLNARDTSVPGGRYRFDGGWVDQGIPADQAHAAPALARMARVDTTYYADVPLRIGGTSRAVLLPGSFFVFSSIFATPMPLTRAEYAFGPAGTVYSDAVLGNLEDFADPSWFDQEPHALAPGSRTATTWLRNPIVQSVPDPAPGSAFPTTLACRTGTSLTVVLPLLDNVPSHVGEVWGDPSGRPVAHFTLTRNGRTLFDRSDYWGAVVDATAATATYRAVSTIDRRLAEPNLSTRTTTEVTFLSGASTGRATPAGWFCPSGTGSGSTLLPVLRALVDLGGTTRGTVPVGTSTFDVQVGYPQAAGAASVGSVTVEVARAGSGAWTSLPVTAAGSGHYAAAFSARAWQAGQAMDLRVGATDASGGILHQTTTRAFIIGS